MSIAIKTIFCLFFAFTVNLYCNGLVFAQENSDDKTTTVESNDLNDDAEVEDGGTITTLPFEPDTTQN